MSNGAGPQTVSEWAKYLHAAAQVTPDSPDYGEARDAIAQALRHINALHVGETMSEATASEQPSLAQSLATVVGQGPGLGTGEVFRGVGSAIAGQGFGTGAQEYREAVDQAEAANPNLQAVGQLVGSAGLPGTRLGQGLAQGVKAGIPLGLKGGAKLIAQGALSTAVPGAVAGFSSGGADASDLPARLEAGGKGAILAGLLGGVTTGMALPVVRGHVERAADIANAGVMRKLEAQRLRNAEGVGMRLGQATPEAAEVGEVGTAQERALAKHFGRPVSEFQGRVRSREASGTPSAAQPISPGPPGSGMKAQAAAPTWGGTLPYYPRGGQLEQAVPPPPVESPRVQGPASPAAAARRAPYAELRRVLQEPATPGRIKNIILTELQRRGIVGEGLLPPP